MNDEPDPARMPEHEPTWSQQRGGANVIRLGAIAVLFVQNALMNFREWRHPPKCPYCRARIANTDLHCPRCGADLPEMMFRSPAEGIRFDALVMVGLLILFVGLMWRLR